MKSSIFSSSALMLIVSMFLLSTPAGAWGQKGHDVTCAVAQNHLSKSAKKQVDELLHGKSLVYWANWLDNASHTPDFAYTKTWHYKNIDADETYENALQCETGDVITAISAQIRTLQDPKAGKPVKALALKMLVHLVGDMHCPMHMAHRSDRGGNRWQVQYFNNGTNLHSVWDSAIVESAHKWTYSEWAQEIDTVSDKEAAALVKGTLDDWAKETFAITTKIYDQTPVGSKLSYDYVSQWTPTVEDQLLKGGLRLAYILNSILK